MRVTLVALGLLFWNKSNIPECCWQAVGKRNEKWIGWLVLLRYRCCSALSWKAKPLNFPANLHSDPCPRRPWAGKSTYKQLKWASSGGWRGRSSGIFIALRIVPLPSLKAFLKRGPLRWFGFLVKMPQASPWWGGPGIYQWQETHEMLERVWPTLTPGMPGCSLGLPAGCLYILEMTKQTKRGQKWE